MLGAASDRLGERAAQPERSPQPDDGTLRRPGRFRQSPVHTPCAGIAPCLWTTLLRMCTAWVYSCGQATRSLADSDADLAR